MFNIREGRHVWGVKIPEDLVDGESAISADGWKAGYYGFPWHDSLHALTKLAIKPFPYITLFTDICIEIQRELKAESSSTAPQDSVVENPDVVNLGVFIDKLIDVNVGDVVKEESPLLPGRLPRKHHVMNDFIKLSLEEIFTNFMLKIEIKTEDGGVLDVVCDNFSGDKFKLKLLERILEKLIAQKENFNRIGELNLDEVLARFKETSSTWLARRYRRKPEEKIKIETVIREFVPDIDVSANGSHFFPEAPRAEGVLVRCLDLHFHFLILAFRFYISLYTQNIDCVHK